MSPRWLVTMLVAVAMVAGACSNGDTDRPIAFVPSSFTDVTWGSEAFTGIDPEWVIAGSTRLITQLEDGAEADLLITADQASMDQAAADGLVTEQLGVVARNRLVLAVAPGNPAGIESLDAMADEGLLIGVCAPAVPCGRLAADALAAAGIDLAADTEEANVRALAAKIEQGELDAGLVYASDVMLLELDAVDDPRLATFVNSYPAALVGDSERGRAVFDALTSHNGRVLLRALGFQVP